MKIYIKRAGNKKDFVGWLELPNNYDKKEFDKIKKAAEKIKKRFRDIDCNRNRWLLFGGKSGYRGVKQHFL